MLKRFIIGIWMVVGIVGIHASFTKGYKDNLYHLNPKSGTFCEVGSVVGATNWCVDIQSESLGFYLGFNQAIVYSSTELQAIDFIRQRVKWSLPLANVHKIHINYPVIVVSTLAKSIQGYDYFSGFKLWELDVPNYKNMFETNTHVWVYQNKQVRQLDTVSGEFTLSIDLDIQPNRMVGNDVYLFFQTPNDTYFYHLISKLWVKINNGYQIKGVTSELVWLGTANGSDLRTFSNRIVSRNVQVPLKTIFSPSKSWFSAISSNQLSLISERSERIFEFTPTANNDIMYAYKVGNQLQVLYEGGHAIWVLKQKNKNKFVLDI